MQKEIVFTQALQRVWLPIAFATHSKEKALKTPIKNERVANAPEQRLVGRLVFNSTNR